MADARTRPLSPHITIWRWGPAMALSILHRATGDGMALVGLPVLLWWLYSVAAGPAAYQTFADHAGTWYGNLVLIGLTYAFLSHMASGLRHFVLDAGAGYELTKNAFWSVATPLFALAATIAVWATILLR